MGPASTPTVSLIERSGLLPDTCYYSAVVPDGRSDRAAWQRSLLPAAGGVDLAFVDPDNGIDVPSKPVGRRGSSKYVLWQEIGMLWAAGCSVLIYQHFPRRPREAFARQLASELGEHTGPHVSAFSTARVLFLLAAQAWHAPRLQQGLAPLSERWQGHITPLGPPI